MCGIAGIVSLGNTGIDNVNSLVNSMITPLQTRGPDDSNVWINHSRTVAFGHTRLSILDLSPLGSQPMKSKDGRYVITYNGEIYNHLDLRLELSRSKDFWSGSSDTETLLECITTWGLEKTLNKCYGMFAFAIYDSYLQRLVLARDRFGQKPLYYILGGSGSDEHRMQFSSSIYSLVSFSNRKFSDSALSTYFQYGCISSPLSIYDDICQLLPGHMISIDIGTESSKYKKTIDLTSSSWVNQNILHIDFQSSDNLYTEFDNLFSTIVSQHSLSDVPIGCFLSGGIDSSLIALYLQKVSMTPVNTFTVSFPDNPYLDESLSATQIASCLGTNHTTLSLSYNDLLSIIPNLPTAYSEPFADSSQVPTLAICELARQNNLSVCLSGDGGDELFGGYNRHGILPLSHLVQKVVPVDLLTSMLSLIGSNVSLSNGLNLDKYQKLLSLLSKKQDLQDAYLTVRSVFDFTELSQLIPNIEFFHTELNCTSDSMRQNIMDWDLIHYLPNDILTKVDRASMAVSLETRAPFLDTRLFEFSRLLPSDMKNNYLKGKVFLRNILYEHFPKDIIDRPKAGFAVPIGQWLRGPLREWAGDLLSPSMLEKQGILEPSYVTHLFQVHQLGDHDYSSKLWTLLMWQSWNLYNKHLQP